MGQHPVAGGKESALHLYLICHLPVSVQQTGNCGGGPVCLCGGGKRRVHTDGSGKKLYHLSRWDQIKGNRCIRSPLPRRGRRGPQEKRIPRTRYSKNQSRRPFVWPAALRVIRRLGMVQKKAQAAGVSVSPAGVFRPSKAMSILASSARWAVALGRRAPVLSPVITLP